MAESTPGQRVFIVFVLLATFSHSSRTKECDYTISSKKYTLYDWTWQVVNGNNSYYVNFCNSPSQCSGSTICQKSLLPSGSVLDLGKKPSDIAKASTTSADGSSFSITFDSGIACPSDKKKTTKSQVQFLCGKSLGSLEILEENPCLFVFEFYTTRVCKNYKDIKETSCYAFNTKYELFDLSPLILDKGGHTVESSLVSGFRINVCRELSHVTLCPSGSSACIGSTNVGEITSFSDLAFLQDGKLHLRYAISKCSTNITFACPKVEGQVGSGPKLLSVIGCHYEILWETEYACPYKVSPSKTCSVTTPRGVVDLSPLQSKSHKATFGKYTYMLRVCKNLDGFDCNPFAEPNSESFAGCQIVGSSNGTTIGDANHMTLSYLNGKVVLIYRHGAKCRTGYMRRTIITFTCDSSAGLGEPKFSTELYCNYYFNWATSVVCQKSAGNCRVVTDQNVIYDLSKLVRGGNDNWLAENSGVRSPGDLYINVCSKLNTINPKLKSCPKDSSACLVDKSGKGFGLGQYEGGPVVAKDKSGILLTYLNGGACEDSTKTTKTVIRFVCAPGQLSSSPVLMWKTMDKCLYTIEWLTVFACPLGVHTEKDCKLSDPRYGFSFDLNPLKQLKTPGKDYISVKAEGYDFQLKVCEGSKQTACSSTKLVGGCQYKKSANMTHIMGLANSELMYFDGMLNLTYHGGEVCKDKARTARQVHMTFLCDHSAGLGQPRYEKEVGCGQYNFLWFTKYACMPKIVQCLAFNEEKKQFYDLSGLGSRTSWQTTSGSSRYYINVCGPLYEKPSSCSSFSAACVITSTSASGGENVEVKNLGEVAKPPTALKNGDIELVYTGGDPCSSGKKISTKIRFICRADAKQGSPEFVKEESNDCSYVFRWETEHACPTSEASKVLKCSVKDPASDYTFNLTPLKKVKSYYTVTNSQKETFAINVCGDVDDSPCEKTIGGHQVASCLVDKKKSIALGTFRGSLEVKSGQVVLTYVHGDRAPNDRFYETVIQFSCDRRIPFGKPIFQSKTGAGYVFRFPTSLACAPQAVECKVVRNGKETYSLQPLEKEDGYWTAINRQYDGRNHQYLLGVCGPIAKAPPLCRQGPFGACQLVHDKAGDRGFNMGFVQSSPSVGSGVISIRYLNGAVCHKKYHRSTRILFHCSQFQGSPVFQLETCDCEYVFNWLTPSACPQINQDGKDCKVMDSLYQHQFDLNPLNGVYEITSGGLKMTVPVCKKGKTACGEACIDQGGKSDIIGTFNTDLKLINGDLTLQYDTKDSGKSVVIKFICDKAAGTKGKGPVSPQGFSKTTNHYELEWRTSLACHSTYEMECSVSHYDGTAYSQYDLSPLARWDDNWRPLISRKTSGISPKTKIYINVCRQLVRNSDSNDCSQSSGICMKKEDGSFVNLGIMERSPQVTGSSITLEYKNGDICRKSPEQRYEAKVILTKAEKDIGEPILIAPGHCQYTFQWQSSAARAVKTDESTPTTSQDCKPAGSGTTPSKSSQEWQQGCRVTNPLTGFVYDLNALRKKTDYKVEKDGKYVLLNICGPLQTSKAKEKCGDNSNICVLSDGDDTFHVNAGSYHGKLKHNGVLYLDYKRGDVCPKSGLLRRSVITFVCAKDEDTELPELLSSFDDCTYFFVWRTKHACEAEVQCTAFSDDKDFSFSSLKRFDGNYQASVASGIADSNTKFYINICRNLHSATSIKCPPGVAACSVNGDIVKSLGRITKRPLYTDDGNIVLTYKNGSPCKKEGSVNITTHINFKCGTNVGNPVLTSVRDECTYEFEWKTRSACTSSDKEKQDLKKCTLQDNGFTFDLGVLKRAKSSLQKDYKVKSDLASVSYLINVCGVTSVADPKCVDAAVCEETIKDGKYSYQNIGSLSQAKIDYDRTTKKLALSYGQKSDSSLLRSKILFTCAPLVFPGTPTLSTKAGTEYVFEWETAVACVPQQKSCSVNWNNQLIAFHGLDKANGYTVEDTKNKQKYFINVCSGVSNFAIGCPYTAAVCRQPLGGGTTEILSSFDEQEISGTNDFVKVTFGEGATTRGNVPWKAEIHISCSTSDLEGPQLLYVNESAGKVIFGMKSKQACFLRKSTHKHVPSPKPKGSAAGTITAVILAVIVAFALAIIFRKKERRANAVSFLRYGFKRYVCCKRSGGTPFTYDEVHEEDIVDDDDDESLLSPIGGDDKEGTAENEYHDESESDEELLRL